MCVGGLCGVMSAGVVCVSGWSLLVDRVNVVCWRSVARMEWGGVTHLAIPAPLGEF